MVEFSFLCIARHKEKNIKNFVDNLINPLILLEIKSCHGLKFVFAKIHMWKPLLLVILECDSVWGRDL